MNREFAKPIAQGLGVLAIVILALVAKYFDVQLRGLPGWSIVLGIVVVAMIIVFAAKAITNRFS